MNRKNTILIAVMINAGLLVLLFITALTTREEILPAVAMTESPQLVESSESPKPMFGENADLALRQKTEEPAAMVTSAPMPAETPVLHTLPPLAAEEPPAQQPVAVAPEPPAPAQNEIIVKKGDSLEKIAKAHHTTVDEIIKLNHLPSSFLRVGQQLKIPVERKLAMMAAKSKPLAVSSETPEYYTIKVGDNPWTIAMKHHMKVEELLRLNGLNEEKARKLKPGDRLRVR